MPSKAKASQASMKAVKQGTPAQALRPQWPLLKPLVPACDLSLECLLDNQLLVVHKLFTVSLCQRYVGFLSSLPLVTTPNVAKEDEALRVNDRFQINDYNFAEQIWNSTALRELVSESNQDWGGEPVALNPNIRIYRYTKGQYFGEHYDESNLVTLPTLPPIPCKTTWTLLIYLTACSGGETVFYPQYGQVKNFDRSFDPAQEPISISPEAGLALLHRHGDDCLLHEAREVVEGQKWVIRSDICVKR